MALRYFSITKEVPFQGRAERFSNVYLYEMTSTTTAALNTQIDSLVAAERPIHAPQVSFVEARCYTTNGLNGVTDFGTTYVVRPITATPGTGAGGGIYRELAFLCKWELPRKVGTFGGLGRQRSLKKWIHSCNDIGATSGFLGETALAPNPPTRLATYMAAVTTMNGYPMVAPDGSLTVGGTGVMHPYLEHRQFPAGRKEA